MIGLCSDLKVDVIVERATFVNCAVPVGVVLVLLELADDQHMYCVPGVPNASMTPLQLLSSHTGPEESDQ